jgi:virulence factor Mce-like protein
MVTRAPSATRVLIAAGFALSCFALALFLWIAFGGAIPLRAEGYRFTVPFDEATQLAVESDVRISGVSVGKVKSVELGDSGLADATIELDAKYAPVPTDTRAILRQKTLLGETYVELTPGSDSAPALPEGGSLPAAQVSDSVQLDEIFRTFDEPTRAAFQAWMQGAAGALHGRGEDVSAAIAELQPFAEQADTALRLLDSQRLAVHRLIRDGGDVFAALSERQGQLQGLVRNADTVFATTARRNAELADTFRILPHFLRESRTTLSRLKGFAQNTDPLVQQLRPAARQLRPTLLATGDLAPELQRFFDGLRGTIDASGSGFPALRRLLDDDLPPLLTRLDPFLAQLNPILQVAHDYRHEVTAFLGNAAAATNASTRPAEAGGNEVTYLRTTSPLGPDALAAYPQRLAVSRANAYVQPGGYSKLPGGLDSFETRQCGSGVHAVLNPADAGAFPGDLFDRIKEFAFAGQLDSNDIPAPPCTKQAPFASIGLFPEFTDYLHVRREP